MELTRNLKKGMSGEDVRAVKEKLFALGFYSTKITKLTNDTLGSDSVDAIKRFQLKNGLEADGIVGPAAQVEDPAGHLVDPVPGRQIGLDRVRHV